MCANGDRQLSALRPSAVAISSMPPAMNLPTTSCQRGTGNVKQDLERARAPLVAHSRIDSADTRMINNRGIHSEQRAQIGDAARWRTSRARRTCRTRAARNAARKITAIAELK